MSQSKKAGDMNNHNLDAGIEKQKIELIKLRIKNKYYERDEVYNKVVSELLNKELNKKKWYSIGSFLFIST